MTISERALAAMKDFEGFRACAYEDCVGVLTIGYGETKGVKLGDVTTESAADSRLRQDVSLIEKQLSEMLTVPVTQGQFDALADFAYNLGAGSLMRSTLLRLVNDGDFAGAAAEFSKWAMSRGRVLPGLMKRRLAEREWFTEAVKA